MQGWLHKWAAVDLGTVVRTGVDILIIWYLIYRLMMLAKGTRAWQIISGLLVFVFILWVSTVCQLSALNWVLKQMFLLGPVAIVILFYPELRHALEEVGRLGFWGRGFTGLEKEDLSVIVSEVVRATETLSAKKVGALMVLERTTGLTDYIETGTLINAVVSAELLCTLFHPGSPLHDGAAIIRRDRVVAAGCTLPLSENRDIGAQVHTRHKAALGISEQSDALVLVVSEESGIISLAFEGRMIRYLRGEALRDFLIQTFLGRERPARRRNRARAKAPSPRSASVPVVAAPVSPPAAEEDAARDSEARDPAPPRAEARR